MEKPENRLMYLNICDEDDEYSSELRSDYSPDQTFIRLDSVTSADNFIGVLPPNLSHLGSQDTLVRMTVTEADRPSLMTVASFDEISDRRRRPRSATFDGNGRSRSPHSVLKINKSMSDATFDEDCQYLSPGMGSSPSGRTTPDVDKIQRMSMVDYNVPRVCAGQSILRSDSGSSDGSYPGAASNHKVHPHPAKPGLPLEENLRSKLNQRRGSRTEKRYLTADDIKDMRKDRDSSIHKRLSWNLGTVDISIDERSILKNKTFSSDSLRSMPSSSGVSSTGSLHLSPESEINEECESESASISSVRFSHVDYPSHQADMQTQTQSIAEHEGEMDAAANTTTGDSKLSPQNKHFSKSMPNISHLNVSLGDIQDGIVSVQMPTADTKRKVTHSELLRMKKLLLNSTLEAS